MREKRKPGRKMYPQILVHIHNFHWGVDILPFFTHGYRFPISKYNDFVVVFVHVYKKAKAVCSIVKDIQLVL